MSDRPRVLVLARTFPNEVLPTQGLWVRRLVRAAAEIAEPVVVAPVPYVPPLLPLGQLSAFRRLPDRRSDGGVEVHHPRVPTGPGTLLHALDARMQLPFVRRLVDRLHAARPFDLIHAHFVYPDGVIAAQLGARYGIPVVTTEHADWLPWMDRFPTVARQVHAVLDGIDVVTAVSESTLQTVRSVAGDSSLGEVLHNVVDDHTFRLPPAESRRDRDKILFVGVVRRVKGLDVLVRALARLGDSRPRLRLDVIGEPFQRSYRKDEADVRRLASELGVSERIRFVGGVTPGEVAAAMQEAALLVVPSRRESFSVVAAEALACGTPVVATRCGGPEEIVSSDAGVLVPPDSPEALASAVDEALSNPDRFVPERLRRSVVARFGWEAASECLGSLYGRVLEGAGDEAERRLRNAE